MSFTHAEAKYSPSVISFGDCSYIEYTYDAGGARLRTKYGVQAGVGPLTPSGTGNAGSDGDGAASPDSQASLPSQDELSRIDYCGNVIYDRGERKLLLENGYVTFNNNTNAPSYHFYLRDHLGNNRVVIDQDGTVEQVTHYYTFAFGRLFLAMAESMQASLYSIKSKKAETEGFSTRNAERYGFMIGQHNSPNHGRNKIMNFITLINSFYRKLY